MAIKGKTKSRSRRVVAIPPRPPLYVRKPPIWRRPWFLATVGLLAVAGILMVVFISLHNSHAGHRKAELAALKSKTLSAVTSFQTQIQSMFPPPPSSQALPPTGYSVYPQLAKDLADLGSGKLDPKQAQQRATDLTNGAKASADAIDKLDVSKLIPEDAPYGPVASVHGKGATRLEMNDAKQLIAQAFRLYQVVGGLFDQAAKATGDTRKALVDQATALTQQAASLFQRGYQRMVNVKSQLEPLPLNTFPPGSLGGGVPQPGSTP